MKLAESYASGRKSRAVTWPAQSGWAGPARRRPRAAWAFLEWILLGLLVGAAAGATLLAHGWRP